MYFDKIPISTDLLPPLEGYENYVNYLKKRSDETKKYFLKLEPFSLTNSLYGLNCITQVYINCFLFPDEQFYCKLFEFGIKRDELKWVLSFETLDSEFRHLENQGMVINKHLYLWQLIPFYQVFISKEVLTWTEIYEDTRAGEMEITTTSMFEKALNRVNYSAKRKYKRNLEQTVNNEIANFLLEVEKNTPYTAKQLIGMIKAEIPQKFLLDWLIRSFPYRMEILKSNSFLRQIQPLNRLVFKNKTEPQIEDIDEDSYKGKSLETIQCQFWRKWLFKK